MSCEACSFPYSLCQCPVTITAGELARLRLAEKELIALKAQPGGVGSLFVRKPGKPRVFCAWEDCDQEPDSTGFCEGHRQDSLALRQKVIP